MSGVSIEKHLLVSEFADDPARLLFERETFEQFREARRNEIWLSAKRTVDPESSEAAA